MQTHCRRVCVHLETLKRIRGFASATTSGGEGSVADQIASFSRQNSQQDVQMVKDVLQQGISGEGDTPAGGHLRLVRAELLADEHNWVSLLHVRLHGEHCCSGAQWPTGDLMHAACCGQ